MIQRLKDYLLRANLDALDKKIENGTATEQDHEAIERMNKYEHKGFW